MNKIKLALASLLVGALIVGCGGRRTDQATALTSLKQTQAAIAAAGSGKSKLTFTKTPEGLSFTGNIRSGENIVRLRDGSININTGASSVRLNGYRDTTTITDATELAGFKKFSDIIATNNAKLTIEATFTFANSAATATITNYSVNDAANSFASLTPQQQADLTSGASRYITDFLIN